MSKNIIPPGYKSNTKELGDITAQIRRYANYYPTLVVTNLRKIGWKDSEISQLFGFDKRHLHQFHRQFGRPEGK